jgi:hypothetical protein
VTRYVRAAIPLLCCVALVLQGCSLTFDATRLGVPVTMASNAATPAQGTPFHVTRRAVYGLWGLVKISEPSLRKSLASQLVGGQGVADLRIRVRTKFTDLLITGLTLGLIAPRAVTFDGVIVGQ